MHPARRWTLGTWRASRRSRCAPETRGGPESFLLPLVAARYDANCSTSRSCGRTKIRERRRTVQSVGVHARELDRECRAVTKLALDGDVAAHRARQVATD